MLFDFDVHRLILIVVRLGSKGGGGEVYDHVIQGFLIMNTKEISNYCVR